MGEDKNYYISLFYICYKKIKTKRHIINIHNIQIKQDSALFSGTIGIFSRSIQEIK